MTILPLDAVHRLGRYVRRSTVIAVTAAALVTGGSERLAASNFVPTRNFGIFSAFVILVAMITGLVQLVL